MLKVVDNKRAPSVNISATAEAGAVIFTITCTILEKWPHEDEGSTHKCEVELQKGPQSLFRATSYILSQLSSLIAEALTHK
jgi:hypothetical protein